MHDSSDFGRTPECRLADINCHLDCGYYSLVSAGRSN